MVLYKRKSIVTVLISHYTVLYLPFPFRFERTKTSVHETMTGSRWDQSVYPRSRNMCQHPWVSKLCNCMSFVDSNLDDKTGHDHWHVTIDLSKGRNGKSNRYTAVTTLSDRLCNSRCYLSVHKTHPLWNLFLKSELPSTRFTGLYPANTAGDSLRQI